MAVSSNIEKYTINGVEIPVYPSSLYCEEELISKSHNDMYATFHDIPIALKAKVNWIYDFVSSDELKELYGNMIRNQIIKSGSRFFELNTEYPGIGFISGKFYVGAPIRFTSKGTGYGNGKVPYWQLEIHWIEVDGIQLNSPLTTFESVAVVNGKSVSINNLSEALEEG